MSLQSKEELKINKEKYLIPCSYTFYDDPIVYSRGYMQHVYDENDNKYLDFLGGFSVISLGYSNPIITNNLKLQMDKMIHSTQVFLNQPIIDLAMRLEAILPDPLQKSFFVNSGSEGNEMAISLARNYTKKDGVIYLENSLHGRTDYTLSITGVKMWQPYDMNNHNVYMAKSFHGNDLEHAMEQSLASVEDIISKNDNIACMISEVIQGNGGVLTAHKNYFKRLKELLNKHNILLIIDEAQSGYARTGKMFAFEHFDFVPDILMTCKALGNGMPIASVTTSSIIANEYKTPSASTTGGNQLSCISAISVIDYITSNNIINQVNELSNYFEEKLNSICQDKDIQIRGIGLFRGLAFSSSDILEQVLEGLKSDFIIAGKCGQDRNVMLIQPPLIITKNDIDTFIKSLKKQIKDL